MSENHRQVFAAAAFVSHPGWWRGLEATLEATREDLEHARRASGPGTLGGGSVGRRARDNLVAALRDAVDLKFVARTGPRPTADGPPSPWASDADAELRAIRRHAATLTNGLAARATRRPAEPQQRAPRSARQLGGRIFGHDFGFYLAFHYGDHEAAASTDAVHIFTDPARAAERMALLGRSLTELGAATAGLHAVASAESGDVGRRAYVELRETQRQTGLLAGTPMWGYLPARTLATELGGERSYGGVPRLRREVRAIGKGEVKIRVARAAVRE